MKVSGEWIVQEVVALSLMLSASGFAAHVPDRTNGNRDTAAATCTGTNSKSMRAFPTAEAGCGQSVAYVGSYVPDGSYREDSRRGALLERIESEGPEPATLRPVEVPGFVDLHPRERVVENPLARAHEEKSGKGRSVVADWRDDLLTLVYGREKAMLTPRFLTTDAQGRAIIADPAANAVHVLGNGQEFRILAGRRERLQSVGAVAADALGEIYVAIPTRAWWWCSMRRGRFVREIGRFGENEGLFHSPTALAVDRERRRLYVADASRDLVLELDLNGRMIQRVGGRHQEAGVSFKSPSDILVKTGKVVVLDANGVQVFDGHWKAVRSFGTGMGAENAMDVGMGMDSGGNIFLSDAQSASVRVYDAGGDFRGEFGAAGTRRGEFVLRQPCGLTRKTDCTFANVTIDECRYSRSVRPPRGRQRLASKSRSPVAALLGMTTRG